MTWKDRYEEGVHHCSQLALEGITWRKDPCPSFPSAQKSHKECLTQSQHTDGFLRERTRNVDAPHTASHPHGENHQGKAIPYFL